MAGGRANFRNGVTHHYACHICPGDILICQVQTILKTHFIQFYAEVSGQSLFSLQTPRRKIVRFLFLECELTSWHAQYPLRTSPCNFPFSLQKLVNFIRPLGLCYTLIKCALERFINAIHLGHFHRKNIDVLKLF